ncbi:DMT family transporter [Rhodocytophaga rosea]|uniref:DMT family transporter n=1 Tax=Rhodocytophaga rosea TaxID=2704465 RepID=A0A6C0GDL1_9BACT|nr:DMT family transporter [Rhodocytophaga rosea]QHT66007.1 DMT family transporter [Rhodocytophaga rosea]
MPKEMYYVLALLAGTAVAVQTGANAQLRLIVHSPIITACISFLVGTTVLLLYVLIANRQYIPEFSVVSQISWWKWIGGIMGVIYITTVVVVAPKIGAANTLGFIVAGQLISAVLFDHFGWIGFDVRPISLWRILGVIFLILGVFLLRKQ